MSKNISWIFELTLTKGSVNDLKGIMDELVRSTKENEAGSLIYEWNLNEDNTVCHIYERYLDSENAIKHLKTFNEKYKDRLMSLGEATEFTVYGNPSEKLMEELKGFGGTYFKDMGGFSRLDS